MQRGGGRGASFEPNVKKYIVGQKEGCSDPRPQATPPPPIHYCILKFRGWQLRGLLFSSTALNPCKSWFGTIIFLLGHMQLIPRQP